MTTKNDGGLFPAPRPKIVPGPIYQGVCKTIRALTEAEQLDKKVDAGTIAQARSIASSIDRVSGHKGGYQASGMQLAALHAQLSEVLERLNPAGATDPMQELMDEMDKKEREERARHGHPQAPHPQV